MADTHSLTTPEEDRLIEAEFQDVLNGYLQSNHRKKAEIVVRAFNFAREAHKGVRRRSGEPYILHPIAVAKIASQEIGLGSTSICAALLHDVVEDTDYTVEDIANLFGEKIANIVAGLTKISGGIFGDKASLQAENFRKLLLTMSEDIRVVLIKMADRLHNMRTLGSMAPAKQYKIAGETLYIYAPLAHRLGLFAIKTELEDLSFKYEHPGAYDQIAQQIRESEERRNTIYQDFAAPILERLNEMGLKYEAKARLKSVYSIWRKMETKKIPFEEVYDLYAMRIIFDCDDPKQEKSLCYSIYATLTDLYRPHPERIRDWISNPKANGYQALHGTFMGPDGNWVEVQIRSRQMDEIAEKGFAAHWKYKIGESDEESELSVWLQTIKDILAEPSPNAIDFLDTLKLNLFASEIVVFTPKGDLITLPTGATVLDVAFQLHSNIGSHCIAGKVNHKLVPLGHKLKSGDQVEILTSKTQVPKPEWIEYMATAKGKTALRQVLRRQRLPQMEKGQKIYDDFLAEHEITNDNETLTKILGSLRMPNKEELFVRLADNEVSLEDFFNNKTEGEKRSFLNRLFRRKKRDKKKEEPKTQEEAPKVNLKETFVLREDAEGKPNYIITHCCNPIPGDDVMGFVDEEGRVEVHALNCPRAQALKAAYGPRIVSTRWELPEKRTFPARLRIEGVDRHGILQELAQLISNQMNINIRLLNIQAEKEVFHADLGVLVSDTKVVEVLCDKVKKLRGVTSAIRVS
ncbi:MAG: bifunctional (p)ppGpp synthetase/guanosine-3',5'-bis(diphosphate) 3'-pyrophosphohydrolase [Muribaculaceae bacterium]|nr:bifunctional (p)ppGpp synthetase/guanosine-3',5'-bis(diphosphate) 3'-pyrophosphohydrolase [Muribaculaceae bacterium]